MKVLDLFSGIGGFSLGLERAGMETVAFCEIEDYPRKVLAKHWPQVPCASDVKKLTYQDGGLYDNGKEIYRGSADVICGGFPCQDISVAGNQKGIGEGTRSGLWSECARLLREVRPKYAIFENVTALLSGERGRWFQRVLWDISEIGYDAEWHCIPASELGANHHRDRVWIIAYPNNNGSTTSEKREVINKRDGSNTKGSKPASELEGLRSAGVNENVAHSERQRQQGQGEYGRRISKAAIEDWKAGRADNQSERGGGIWDVEPLLDRVVDGVPNRAHRIKALGNAVVPQIPELIGRSIMEYENVS